MEAGAFIVEGQRALSQIYNLHPESLQEILVDKEPARAWRDKVTTRILTSSQFASISKNKTPQGIAGVVTLPRDSHSSKLPQQYGERMLLLEDVQDPGNVGTLIRAAAAFNFDGVILSEGCADPFSPKAIQASAGSVLSPWIRRTTGYYKLGAKLKREGFRIIATDIYGNSKSIFNSGEKVVLILGNEAKGISNKMLKIADTVFRIPFNYQSVESLNVAAAGAICMYLLSQQTFRR